MDFNILMGILMVILRMLMGFSIIAIGNVGFFILFGPTHMHGRPSPVIRDS